MAKTVSVAEHFAPGEKVAIVPRTSDFASGTRGAVKNVTVDKNGEVKTDGLVEFGAYWVSDGDRSVGINIPGRLSAEPGTQAALAEEQQRVAEAQAEVRSAHPNLANPGHLPDERPDTSKGVADHNFEKGGEPEPTPAAKYVEVSGPQRVGADIGTAFPVDPGEIQPQPGQEHVKDVPQRVGADAGYAFPVDPGEVQPGVKYEDEKGKQRLGADTGTAEPLPKTTSKRAIEEAKSSSVSKARGANAPKAGTSKTPSRKAKGAPKATKAQAAKVAEPVKAEAKRAVKKGDES